MPEIQSVTVRVPASTANLGPGFDCLGLALDIWNEVSFQVGGQGYLIQIEGEGAGKLPLDRSNLILRAADSLYKKAGAPFPSGIQLCCRNTIPVSSGLGSSSSAVIAGLLAAKKLLHSDISNPELLDLAADFEGHADNVAACLLGGLVTVLHTDNGWIAEKIPMQPVKAVIVLPEIQLSTSQARALLPDTVSRQDALANVSRTALLVHALRAGRMDLLAQAMQDRLHQPYRLKLMPGAENGLQAAYAAGASGAALSGAGPSLIAFAQNNLAEIGSAIQQEFTKENIPSKIFQTVSINNGAE